MEGVSGAREYQQAERLPAKTPCDEPNRGNVGEDRWELEESRERCPVMLEGCRQVRCEQERPAECIERHREVIHVRRIVDRYEPVCDNGTPPTPKYLKITEPEV